MSKRSITGTPLKLVWSNYSTIYGSSYTCSYKSACKVLKNSYLKCGGVLHTNVLMKYYRWKGTITSSKIVWSTAVTICKSSYGNKIAWKVLRNLYLKCRRGCSANFCDRWKDNTNTICLQQKRGVRDIIILCMDSFDNG
jgi:hypothetical protein